MVYNCLHQSEIPNIQIFGVLLLIFACFFGKIFLKWLLSGETIIMKEGCFALLAMTDFCNKLEIGKIIIGPLSGT
jgi:hypothetical protein